MRKSLTLLLLVSVLLQSFSQMGIYVSFKINQDYITKVLCINKARPKLGCNGKCYLSRKLKQADQQEQKQTSSPIRKAIEWLHCGQPALSFVYERSSVIVIRKTVSFYLLKPSCRAFLRIFHPPRQ